MRHLSLICLWTLVFNSCTIQSSQGLCSYDSQFKQVGFSVRVNKSKSSVLNLLNQHLQPAGIHQVDDYYNANFHLDAQFAGHDLEKASYNLKILPGKDSLETRVEINGVICSVKAKKYSSNIESFIRSWLK